MAKIHFIQDNIVNESLGILHLSSYLKANGHSVQLSLLSHYSSVEALLLDIQKSAPDIIGFSVMTSQADTYERVSHAIKQRIQLPIIWGGAHCTFMPEVVARNNDVDVICIGEGEESLLELMNRLESHEDYSTISGLWVLRDGVRVRNGLRMLESNLDKYPFPDRELLYEQSALLRRFKMKRLLVQRGCPFSCNYCFEPMLQEMYRGKGRLVRSHSAEYAIAEIKDLISKYPARFIHFSDDSINLNREWLFRFLKSYRDEIKVPFSCNVVVPLLEEDVVIALREAGCEGVVFGVESGVERIRKEILRKRVSDEQYLHAAALLHKHGIKITANTLLCVPTERLADSLATIEFCSRLRVDRISMNILKVYRGTKLATLSLANGWVEDLDKYTLKTRDIFNEHESIKHLVWLGFFFMRMPFLIRFARQMVTWRPIRFFKFLILLTYWQEITWFKFSIPQSFVYFLSSCRLFMAGMGGEYEAKNERL